MNIVSTKTNAAAILTGQSNRRPSRARTFATQFAYAPVLVRRAPAFAPLHRFINCLLAEASDRTE